MIADKGAIVPCKVVIVRMVWAIHHGHRMVPSNHILIHINWVYPKGEVAEDFMRDRGWLSAEYVRKVLRRTVGEVFMKAVLLSLELQPLVRTMSGPIWMMGGGGWMG